MGSNPSYLLKSFLLYYKLALKKYISNLLISLSKESRSQSIKAARMYIRPIITNESKIRVKIVSFARAINPRLFPKNGNPSDSQNK